MWMKCSLCQRQAIEDDLVDELNPATNRWALMHPTCLLDVYEDLSQEEKDAYQAVRERGKRGLKFCQQCRTQPATLKRDGQFFCADCYDEKPLVKATRWDEVINPVYILALESRIERLEKLIAGMEADS